MEEQMMEIQIEQMQMPAGPSIAMIILWVVVYVFFAYSMVNFLLFLAATFAEPLAGSSGSGTPPAVFRGFSGHWMAFYSAALGILYSAMRAGERGVEPRCPKGHPVSPFARFCEECGERLIPEDHVDSSNGSA